MVNAMSAFNKDSSRRNGYDNKCRDCRKQFLKRGMYKRDRTAYWKIYSNTVLKTPDRILKLKSRTITKEAIKHGVIKKEDKCSKCRSDRHVQAHHSDYNKPLEITWLCKPCHWEEDRKLGFIKIRPTRT